AGMETAAITLPHCLSGRAERTPSAERTFRECLPLLSHASRGPSDPRPRGRPCRSPIRSEREALRGIAPTSETSSLTNFARDVKAKVAENGRRKGRGVQADELVLTTKWK